MPTRAEKYKFWNNVSTFYHSLAWFSNVPLLLMKCQEHFPIKIYGDKFCFLCIFVSDSWPNQRYRCARLELPYHNMKEVPTGKLLAKKCLTVLKHEESLYLLLFQFVFLYYTAFSYYYVLFVLMFALTHNICTWTEKPITYICINVIYSERKKTLKLYSFSKW